MILIRFKCFVRVFVSGWGNLEGLSRLLGIAAFSLEAWSFHIRNESVACNIRNPKTTQRHFNKDYCTMAAMFVKNFMKNCKKSPILSFLTVVTSSKDSPRCHSTSQAFPQSSFVCLISSLHLNRYILHI